MRVGIGYDVHKFDDSPGPPRRLVLGGVEVPFTKWLEGWSDADVLTHAIIDALLGAAALGDIGSHFPSGEEEYKGICSLELLKRVSIELAENGWQVINVDATVIAEWPKLGSYIIEMRGKISQMLGIALSRVSVKAETSGTIGYAGRGDGIGCFAIALLQATSE